MTSARISGTGSGTRSSLPALRFPSMEDERGFTEERYALWLRQSIVGGLLAVFFNDAFLLMDYLISPAVFEVGLRVRLYWCTSIGLVVPAVGYAAARGVIQVPHVVQEGLVVAGAALVGLSILLVAALSPIHDQVWGVLYHVGLVPIMVVGTVMKRLRFRVACVLVGCILVMHWTALALMPPVPQAPVWSVMLSVGMPAVFMLCFSYAFELAERRRFAQRQREKALRAQLQSKRQSLEKASYLDPLTGVLNRRGFSLHMATLATSASSACSAPEPYALFLLDVDHFKRYNDGYGHLAGDDCLCKVAQALGRATAHWPAALARWGGEEFVIALAGAGGHDLQALGQSLCQAVRAQALAHAHSPTGSVVTVSIGMVSLVSLPGNTPWPDVLARADAALYQAKHEGRDRAMLAS